MRDRFFLFCFACVMFQFNADAQDTIFSAQIVNTYNGSSYDSTYGIASIIQNGDAFKLELSENFNAPNAPDVHIFFAKELAPSDEQPEGGYVDFYTFPDRVDINGSYSFDISPALVEALDTLNYITFECVTFGNILFGGGMWEQKLVSSIYDQKISSKLVVYPNPASDMIGIQTDYDSPIRSISVSSSQGRILISSRVQVSHVEHAVDVTSLRPGTYFLLIEFENGKFGSQLFVKE